MISSAEKQANVSAPLFMMCCLVSSIKGNLARALFRMFDWVLVLDAVPTALCFNGIEILVGFISKGKKNLSGNCC